MPGIEDRIADLERRLKQAKALKQQQVARERAADKKRQRSDDTRRKILVGAVVLAKVERGEWPKERLREWMDQALTRADDRALFGLLAVPSEAGTRPQNTAPD
ncbi:MAG: mobilization protein [Candidatus Competibacter sp.]